MSLQDRFGVNVNLLLFGICLGSEFGLSLSREDVSSAERVVARWQVHVVNTLRDVRRFLKATGPSTDPLRRQIKSAELAAERIETAMLAEWYLALRPEGPRGDRNTAIICNCRSVLAHYGAGQTELPQWLVKRALARKAPTSRALPAVNR